jgi:hypothetical protein
MGRVLPNRGAGPQGDGPPATALQVPAVSRVNHKPLREWLMVFDPRKLHIRASRGLTALRRGVADT